MLPLTVRSEPPIGVVLAGGASRRMGRDKATLPWRGEPLALHAARRLEPLCAEVAVADGGRGLLAGYRSLADAEVPGPASGILGAAAAYPSRCLLVLACDLPRVSPGLLAELVTLARPAEVDWCVPRWRGGLEPLCALYAPGAVAALAERAARGLPAPHQLAEASLVVCYLETEALARCGDPGELFLNLNTPEDLLQCRENAADGRPGAG